MSTYSAAWSFSRREGGPHGAECTRASPSVATGRHGARSGSSPPGWPGPEPGFTKTPVLHVGAPRQPGAARGLKSLQRLARRCCRYRGDAGAAPAAGGERPPAGAQGQRGPAGTTSNYRGRRRRGWGWRCRRHPRYVGAEQSPRRGVRRETAAKNCGEEAVLLGSLRFSTSS